MNDSPCMGVDGESDLESTQPSTYQEHDLPGSSLMTPEIERAPTDLLAVLTSLSIGDAPEFFGKNYHEMTESLNNFELWASTDQVAFVKLLISRMSHQQLGNINAYIKPLLKRDFIRYLPGGISEQILSSLDAQWLINCELISSSWRQVIAVGQLWKKLIEQKIKTDMMWRGLAEKRGWMRYLLAPRIQTEMNVCATLGLIYDQLKNTPQLTFELHKHYKRLHPRIKTEIERVEDNWRHGMHVHQRIDCQSENSRGVYCLQYDDEKIVSGLRDNTIKLWNREDLSLRKVLTGHTGSVLCLQYDDRIIISGSSDATVRVWDINTGECLNTLIHHGEAVLHLRFGNGTMVTCSKDRSITVWDMVSPREITVRRVLSGHRAAVNAVDFDNDHIVSGSGDRTIKVWSVDTCQFIRTLAGHRRGIACLQYKDGLVVSGSSDYTIRIWEIATGQCIRVLEGHNELVRCIRFDSKRIISGAYDGKIKIWDFKAAVDSRISAGSLCLATLEQHQGRVFRLQFDEFQIVSSSHDDSIVIWDFLNARPANACNVAVPQVARIDAIQPNQEVQQGPMAAQQVGPAGDDGDADVEVDAEND